MLTEITKIIDKTLKDPKLCTKEELIDLYCSLDSLLYKVQIILENLEDNESEDTIFYARENVDLDDLPF